MGNAEENMDIDIWGLKDYGLCLLIERYFCKGYDHGQKTDLSKGYWNLKREM